MVIRDTEERGRIVGSVHAGVGDSDEARCLSAHFGRDKTVAKILGRFYWKGVTSDVNDYITRCIKCQKMAPRLEREQAVLHSV